MTFEGRCLTRDPHTGGDDMKVGILGTGDVGKAIAKGLLALGEEVMIGARSAGDMSGARPSASRLMVVTPETHPCGSRAKIRRRSGRSRTTNESGPAARSGCTAPQRIGRATRSCARWSMCRTESCCWPRI